MARRQVGGIHRAHPSGLIVRPSPQHRGPGKSSASTAAIVASLEARSNCLLRRHVRAGCAPNGAPRMRRALGGNARRWRTGGAPVRRRHRDVPPANPGERARTRSTWMCGGRIRGVAFSLVTFSWPRKRKLPARPEAHGKRQGRQTSIAKAKWIPACAGMTAKAASHVQCQTFFGDLPEQRRLAHGASETAIPKVILARCDPDPASCCDSSIPSRCILPRR
jgi:hypothetical protein